MTLAWLLDSSSWNEVGVATVAVIGLVTLLYRVIVDHRKAHDSRSNTHREDRRAQEDRHREEREEWRQAITNHQEKIERSLDTLAEIIKDRHR